jgi:hypothetical protein
LFGIATLSIFVVFTTVSFLTSGVFVLVNAEAPEAAALDNALDFTSPVLVVSTFSDCFLTAFNTGLLLAIEFHDDAAVAYALPNI